MPRKAAKKATKKKVAKGSTKKSKKPNKYSRIIEKVFFDHYKSGCSEFEFEREEFEVAAAELAIKPPKNIGDLIYSFRYRSPLPSTIMETASQGLEWTIQGAGIARYRFKLSKINRIIPSESAYQIKIPDATPEIINMYAKSDEQALLAKVRYNRLIDIFLRVTAYSLQNHLRTTVPGIGQTEIDEIYVGIRDTGQHFIIPVQAKGGNDQIGVTQLEQDLRYCQDAYAALTPRLIAVQFIDDDLIAMFELAFQEDEMRLVNERHYRLVPANNISSTDLQTMADLSD